MSRPEEAGTELDALLASPTPEPGDGEHRRDDGPTAEAPEQGERPSRPARGRLEAWLRGGSDGGSSEGSSDGSTDQAAEGAGPSEAGAALFGQAGGGAGRIAEGVAEGATPGSPDGSPVAGGVLRSIPVDAIEPNAYQPRRHFDEDSLASLAASIEVVGVLQPVLVRAIGPDRYELVAGERRWRAAQRSQLRMIPALVREVDDQGALEQAIVENLHRQDLNALEEAAAYQELIDDFGLTQEGVAGRVGKSRSAVANTLRLLQLPPGVQRLVVEGVLSAGHARALLAVADQEVQIALAERVVTDQLNVRQTEEAVRLLDVGTAERNGDPEGPTGTGKSVGALEVQMLLEERLETRVEVQEAGRGGRMIIRFADEDDLGRIVRLILGDE